MPPLIWNLWPEGIRELLDDVAGRVRVGELDAAAGGCRKVDTRLRKIEAADKLPRATRLQIAWSYTDLSFFWKDVGDLRKAKQALEEALARWAAAVRTSPRDFYARTQLAACHNLLGLMAADCKDTARAEAHYLDAFAQRTEAHNRDVEGGGKVSHEDRCANLTYRAGILCNLCHLCRSLGDLRRAGRHYREAIRELRPLTPPRQTAREREIFEFEADQWERMHGQPHYSRTAVRFLANAKWGRDELRKPPAG